MSVLYVYCPLTLLKSFQNLMENNLTEKMDYANQINQKFNNALIRG